MTLTRRRPCAAPVPTDAPDMFGPVKQPRTVRGEPADLHADIVALRKDGAKVTRHGRKDHLVDGHVVDHRQLHQLAADARRRAADAEQARAAVAPPKPAPAVAGIPTAEPARAAHTEISAKNSAAAAPRHLTTQQAWDALEVPAWARPRPDYVPFWRTQVERSRQ